MPDRNTKVRIVLLGLDESLDSELRSALASEERAVYSEPFHNPLDCLRIVEKVEADLVFCSSDRERYMALLEEVGHSKPELPIVVVSRAPEVSEWLDAIEAGASDYCAAPFEPGHLQWILDSTLKHRSSPTLYRAAG